MANPTSINNTPTQKENLQSWGNNQKIVEKSMFFCVFNRSLRLQEGYYKSEICEWQYSNVPETIWKNCPGKYGIFPVLSLFFHPSFPKTRHSYPNKSYFFEISKTRAIMSQRFCVLSLRLRLRQKFENELLFGQIMPNDSQKHLNNKRLSWKQNKRYLVHFTFSEGFKSTPNSL